HQVWLASAAGPDRATAELEPRVVLLLMVDFIGHLERLVGTWCLPPSLLEFKEDAGKLELETNWFCQNTRSYRLERNEIVHLLRKKKYRFNPVQLINGCFLRVAATDVCLARGIEWVGRRGVLPGEDPWVLNRKTPPTEIWVLREIGNGESMMLKLAARRGEDGQLKQAMADSALRPGELLFGPKQGTTTTQIIEKIARRCNVDADALRAELMNPEARKEGRYLSWPFEEGENGAP
ncbi:MAG: hypothetical protein KAI66_27140, partial [Lentisphaeria bacterium]|nr:hypothetical protein [Lentisphaeria bacterium]